MKRDRTSSVLWNNEEMGLEEQQFVKRVRLISLEEPCGNLTKRHNFFSNYERIIKLSLFAIVAIAKSVEFTDNTAYKLLA